MAVLVEAISVLIRADAIAARYPGGWETFAKAAPNKTMCADGELARIGFMTPNNVAAFIAQLESQGLRHVVEGKAADMVVVDQQRGASSASDWVEIGRVGLNSQHTVVAGRLVGSANKQVVTPGGWLYEGSLSHTFGFVPEGLVQKSLKFLRHKNGLDVHRNDLTGREIFIGRSAGQVGK